MHCFPTGAADAPTSTHVEQNAGCARVHYSPTLQQQNSISSKGLDADFVIQYDVNLRDLMGDVQVSSIFFISGLSTLLSVHGCVSTTVKASQHKNYFCYQQLFYPPCFVLPSASLRCTMATLCIILHPEDFLWFLRMLYLSLMSVAP